KQHGYLSSRLMEMFEQTIDAKLARHIIGYDSFTSAARNVMQVANQEARRFNHDYIGAQHLLLALVKDQTGVVARLLRDHNINARSVCHEIEKDLVVGTEVVSPGRLPETPRLKKVVEYAVEEARSFGDYHVGTGHLLIALLRETDGVAG